ncbi:MAG: hypothetical protein SVV80_13425 [Planctomycetota bacterium]|nr:hypothetical protein [Planctomycetota bacterium]
MRKYQIPDTRLPFINGEIAEIQMDGQPRLVSSVRSADDDGRIYIFDPQTGESIYRRMPDGICGAYMLRTAADGCLYLGCGEGSLVVYDPRADRFEVPVSGEINGITWGGCVTDSLVVWSADMGETCVYNWRKRKLLKVFRPLDTGAPASRYAHNAIECPDGKILVGMNVPQAKLILIDPKTLEATHHTPEALVGKNYTHWLAFQDAGRLAVISDGELFVFRYPSFEIERRVSPLAGIESNGDTIKQTCCMLGGNIYSLIWPGGGLYRIETSAGRWIWEPVKEHLAGDDLAIIYALGDRYICAVTLFGRYLRYDTQTDEVLDCQLDSSGPTNTQTMCVVPQAGRIFGAPFINQRFWSIDLETGSGRDLGRASSGEGQVNCMVWDQATERLIMASYTTCTITAFDPAKPASWPDNPRILAKVGREQMRPKSMVHDGRFIWLTSSAEYGRLGGALSRLDPATGDIRVWRNIVPNQTPNGLLINPAEHKTYFATEVYADGDSKPATERTAQLVSFDTEKLTIDHQQKVRDGTRVVHLLAILPSGKILGLEGKGEFTWHLQTGTLFLWNPSNDSIEYLNEITEKLFNVVVGPDGKIYAFFGKNVCTLTLEGSQVLFEPIEKSIDWIGHKSLQISDGKLYYVIRNEVHTLPLQE